MEPRVGFIHLSNYEGFGAQVIMEVPLNEWFVY